VFLKFIFKNVSFVRCHDCFHNSYYYNSRNWKTKLYRLFKQREIDGITTENAILRY
jgi:hypothetical protein